MGEKVYRKEINWEEVEELMMAGVIQERIAGSQGVDADTLRSRFTEKYGEQYSVYSAKMHSKGLACIEREQIRVALDPENKNRHNMLMYLGRVKLKQRENDTDTVDSPNDSITALQEIIIRQQADSAYLRTELDDLKKKLNINE